MSQRKNSVKNPENSIVRFLVKKDEKKANLSNFINRKLAAQVEASDEKVLNSEHAINTTDEINVLVLKLEEEKKKNEQLTNDLKKSVAFIREFEAVSLTKDIQIENLSKKLESASLNSKVIEKDEQLFSEFSDDFYPEQLKDLRSVKSGLSRDSTFVLKCMRFLYPNPAVLNNVSLTGKLYKNQRKEKMCAKNVDIIRRMLQKRISSEGVEAPVILQRMRRMNKLVRDAITKITTGHKNLPTADNSTAIHSSMQTKTQRASDQIVMNTVSQTQTFNNTGQSRLMQPIVYQHSPQSHNMWMPWPPIYYPMSPFAPNTHQKNDIPFNKM